MCSKEAKGMAKARGCGLGVWLACQVWAGSESVNFCSKGRQFS